MATRVHLADDHTMFRQGLQSILSREDKSGRVASASSEQRYPWSTRRGWTHRA
jgi:DNA-binding NarL/FixJ family response regulator